MNKKGERLVFFVILVTLFTTFLTIGLKDIGSTSGSHNGVVTAVEYNSNIIWDSNIVYFKSDAQSTQEDRYCVNNASVKQELIDASKERSRVTIYFKNNFFLWAWDCNGGDSIIYKIEVNNGN